jgi:hypothetical protein
MVAARAPLNGSGPQEVWINFYRASQSMGGNYTTFGYEIRYYGNGWGSWSGSTQYWSASIAGISRSGSFTIPYEKRNDTYQVIASGYVNKGHDSAGYLSAQGATATINTDHASIGDGSVSVSGVTSPRIPKHPGKPAAPTISDITSKGFKVSWSAPSDNGGSAIDTYKIRLNDSSPSNGSGYRDYDVGGSARSKTITDLEPGTQYWVGIYARNDATWDQNGYSDKSNDSTATTLAGVYVGNADGTAWVAAAVNVGNEAGTAWESIMPKIGNAAGTAWEDPYDVTWGPELVDVDVVSSTEMNLFISRGARSEDDYILQAATDDEFTQGLVEDQWPSTDVDSVLPLSGLTPDTEYRFRARFTDFGNEPVAGKAFAWSNVMIVRTPAA